MSRNSFSPSNVEFFVNKYIGKEIYKKSITEVKKILFADAVKMFQLEMIHKFGSLRNYQKDWLKRNGFKDDKDYIVFLAKQNGVKTCHEYQTLMSIRAGFKNRYERMLSKAKSNGYSTLHQVHEERHRKRGFENQADYRRYLANKNGCKTYSELLKKNRLEKLRKNNFQ